MIRFRVKPVKMGSLLNGFNYERWHGAGSGALHPPTPARYTAPDAEADP